MAKTSRHLRDARVNAQATPSVGNVLSGTCERHTTKRGPGAPLVNVNASTHGVRMYLALGRLPKGASYIRKLLNGFRRSLEAAVIDRDGKFDIYHSALVQSAVRHEGRAQLFTRYMREDNLSLAERISLQREIGNASDARDRCLKQLGLDRQAEADPWSALDAASVPSPLAETVSSAPET